MLYSINRVGEDLPEVMSPQRLHWLDRFGAAGSLLCAIHCALLPLAIALLPSLGVAVLAGDGFEQGFVAFASVFALLVLGWSYRRHRALRALTLLVPGLALLWWAVLYPPLHASTWPHAVVMTTGGTLVGLAHWANLRLNHAQAHCRACAHGAC